MTLEEIIKDKIIAEGPVSFHDYMEIALYYPGKGYYTSDKEKFGEKGDYYTSPVISEIYGQMLGRQLEEMWRLLGKGPFTIVEYGAGSGALALEIIRYLHGIAGIAGEFRYVIIEKSESLRVRQQKLLGTEAIWISDISEISGFTGCVISNEVLDNFSVHSVIMHDELKEVFVDYQDGFTEILKPAGPVLTDYLQQQEVNLPYGYRTEINMEAIGWLQSIAANLERGFIITVDYGYPAAEYYSSKRSLGTLACYHRHTVTANYYDHIGEQDITAHVNFSALNLYGKKSGLQFAGFCNQNYFLRSLGVAAYLHKLESKSKISNSLFQVNKLLMDMGNKFKVLIQKKNTDAQFLTGMQFSGRDV